MNAKSRNWAVGLLSGTAMAMMIAAAPCDAHGMHGGGFMMMGRGVFAPPPRLFGFRPPPIRYPAPGYAIYPRPAYVMPPVAAPVYHPPPVRAFEPEPAKPPVVRHVRHEFRGPSVAPVVRYAAPTYPAYPQPAYVPPPVAPVYQAAPTPAYAPEPAKPAVVRQAEYGSPALTPFAGDNAASEAPHPSGGGETNWPMLGVLAALGFGGWHLHKTDKLKPLLAKLKAMFGFGQPSPFGTSHSPPPFAAPPAAPPHGVTYHIPE